MKRKDSQKRARHKHLLATLFRPVNSRGDVTRLKMVEAAVQVIAKEGLEALTFDRVGRKVGMNKAQVKYHFSSKDILIEKCVELLIRSMQEFFLARVKEAKNWTEELNGLVTGFMDWCVERREHAMVLLPYYTLSSRNKKYRAIHDSLTQQAIQRMKSILQEHAETKKWNDTELEEACYLIWALLDGFAIYTLIGMPAKRINATVVMKGVYAILGKR